MNLYSDGKILDISSLKKLLDLQHQNTIRAIRNQKGYSYFINTKIGVLKLSTREVYELISQDFLVKFEGSSSHELMLKFLLDNKSSVAVPYLVTLKQKRTFDNYRN